MQCSVLLSTSLAFQIIDVLHRERDNYEATGMSESDIKRVRSTVLWVQRFPEMNAFCCRPLERPAWSPYRRTYSSLSTKDIYTTPRTTNITLLSTDFCSDLCTERLSFANENIPVQCDTCVSFWIDV